MIAVKLSPDSLSGYHKDVTERVPFLNPRSQHLSPVLPVSLGLWSYIPLPETRKPKPCTLNPKTESLNPTPQTLHPLNPQCPSVAVSPRKTSTSPWGDGGSPGVSGRDGMGMHRVCVCIYIYTYLYTHTHILYIYIYIQIINQDI